MLFEKKRKTKKENVVLDKRQAFMNRMGRFCPCRLRYVILTTFPWGGRLMVE
jgi:hypothetical protein